MREHMDAIWEKVNEKRALQEAARRMRGKRRALTMPKVSVFALCGLAISLLPIAGAAQCLLF